MTGFIQICDEEGEEPMEIPLEEDGSLSLSTLAAQFPGSCGLKYRHPESRSLRGVRLVEERFMPPEEGWDYVFICNFPKENKRKIEDQVETPISKKRMEGSKCVDLIVLGLPWKTTESDLEEYFESYGELVMTQIKKDTQTGKSKGFGFIRFSSYEAQRRALLQKHFIAGRQCDVRIPNSKEHTVPAHNGKVFVGRLNESITTDHLETYFSEYGKVIDVFIPRPFRGFGFVTFCDPQVVEMLHEDDHVVNGVSVHVTDAIPKNDNNTGGGFGMQQFPGGGNRGGNHNKFHRNDGAEGWNRGNGGHNGGGNWDNNTAKASNQRGNNWNGPGNWPAGANNHQHMDWNQMAGSNNPLAMPLMAALSQASMEILGNMQQHGGHPIMGGGGGVGGGGGGNNSPRNNGGADYNGRHGGSSRGNGGGDNWKRNNFEGNRGGRGDRSFNR